MLGALRAGSPRRIGPYEVLARLGAGGMGEVYLARIPEGQGPGQTQGQGQAEGRYVAVKTVRQDVAGDPAFRDRFRREIRVAALVRSAHAAAPVGGDADAEVPWLATAYVPGPSLAQAVRRGGPLPVPVVRALGARIARALADVHAAGVLHRDLKPGNVMLAVDGPRLIDFGIAKATGATTMTATGMMVGTPSFMSPEHVAGARHVSGASDVFCLGSLLCYAATGEDPFGEGPVAAVLYRVARAEADLGRVPEELRPVIAACLAADPAARPTPEALAAMLGDESGTGGRAPAWPQAVREHIGEYGRELAQLIAAGGPLVEAPAPADAPAVARPADPHAAPTLGPGTPAPSAAPATKDGRGRRRLLAAVLVLALLGGGLGTWLLWPEPAAPHQDPAPRKPVTAAPPAVPRVAGVDDRGLADGSGVVPQSAAQRPAGWQPWRAKLGAPAFGCSGNDKALVCRTTDGWYEALDPATGKKLWAVDFDGTGGRRADSASSYMNDHGRPWIVGKASRPTVHDRVVVLAWEGKLQVRDVRSGAVRWEKTDRVRGTQAEPTRPIVADGMIFAAVRPAGAASEYKTGMAAFSLADGRKLWEKELTNDNIPYSDFRGFEPVAYARGQVYALSDGGLVTYDAKTGALRGQVDRAAADCELVKILGTSAWCVTVPHSSDGTASLHVLDAATLVTQRQLPAAVAGLTPEALSPTAAVGYAITYTSGSYDIRVESGRTLRVVDPRDGRTLAEHPAKPAPAGLLQKWSAPLIAGDQVVYADYAALYTLKLGPGGKPGDLRATPVPGAPGPRAEVDTRDPRYGIVYERMLRKPELIPVGGIAYLVYDKGAVVAMELPKR
ncbi:protein kinase [Streptomyces sp. NPDC090025]|uniref:serine/threonine-protein kinase n=1 Tax=Streptomyces sp. NPDC090025 TaxID=3365922 RepID=UPI003837C9F3